MLTRAITSDTGAKKSFVFFPPWLKVHRGISVRSLSSNEEHFAKHGWIPFHSRFKPHHLHQLHLHGKTLAQKSWLVQARKPPEKTRKRKSDLPVTDFDDSSLFVSNSKDAKELVMAAKSRVKSPCVPSPLLGQPFYKFRQACFELVLRLARTHKLEDSLWRKIVCLLRCVPQTQHKKTAFCMSIKFTIFQQFVNVVHIFIFDAYAKGCWGGRRLRAALIG